MERIGRLKLINWNYIRILSNKIQVTVKTTLVIFQKYLLLNSKNNCSNITVYFNIGQSITISKHTKIYTHLYIKDVAKEKVTKKSSILKFFSVYRFLWFFLHWSNVKINHQHTNIRLVVHLDLVSSRRSRAWLRKINQQQLLLTVERKIYKFSNPL